MLTWDDEVKPSSPNTSMGAPLGHPAIAPSAVSAMPAVRTLDDGAVAPVAAPAAPSAASSAQASSERRVNVADKRIINGQTDVNQLVPFKYKWA